MCHSERVRRLSYLQWSRFDIFCNHRYLAYIFSPVACAVALSKSTSQRLLNWRAFMSEFSYVIRHIPGAENYWSDLLSRLRSVGGGAADSMARSFRCVSGLSLWLHRRTSFGTVKTYYAAFQGKKDVVIEDIGKNIILCLRHRLRKDPLETIDSG